MDIVERLGSLRLGNEEYEVIVDAIEEIERQREVLRMWKKFWDADNDENLLEPLLAEEAMEATREVLGDC